MKKPIIGKNDLKTWCKQNDKEYLLDEWDYENNQLSPEQYFPKSHKEVEWKCKENHCYSARISDRTAKFSGCPYCSGRLPIVGETDLKTWCINNNRQDLIYDWCDELNAEKTMCEYSYASNKTVVWKCHICSNEWSTPIYSRTTRPDGCPKCNVSGTSFPEQFLFLALRKMYKNVNNRDRTNGYEFDIFIPEEKIAIEYNGTYYHSKTLKKDEQKRILTDKNLSRFIIVRKCLFFNLYQRFQVCKGLSEFVQNWTFF